MPEPFKNLFSKALITGIGEHLAKAWPEFDRAGFESSASKNLDALELKQRSAQITDAMAASLPGDFETSAAILLASLAPEEECDVGTAVVNSGGLAGWAVMPMTNYVGRYGLDHFDLSMLLLKEMTKRSSSEFDVRFFLLEYPKRTLAVLKKWTRERLGYQRNGRCEEENGSSGPGVFLDDAEGGERLTGPTRHDELASVGFHRSRLEPSQQR